MKEGMQKSPSMVFELLAEEDKAKVEEKYRRSIDQRLSSSSRSSRQVRQVVSESAAEEETEEEKEEGKGGAGEAGWERRQGEAQGELQQLHEALLLPGASLQQMVREELGDLFIDTRHLHLQEPLGEGGFAVVHKALLQLPGRHAVSVAVKQLKGQEAMVDADKLREFVQEARLLYKVQCPHLVGLQGIGAFDMSSWTSFRNSLFIVQDLMEGGTLKDAVIRQMLSQKKHVYRAADALRWCLCVAHACHYLHSCQPVVVHRDLKLENILLEGGALDCAKAKVADLGLHMRLRRGARGEKSVYAAAAFADGSVGNGALFCASIGRSRNRRAAPHLHPQQHCLSSGSEATQSNASGRDLSAARVRDGGSEGAAASGEAADSVQQLLFLRHPAKEAADAEPLQLHRTESAHGARSALSLLQSSAAGGDAAAQPLAQPPERTSNGLPIVKAPREPKRLLDAAGAGSMTLSEKIQRVEELALTQRGRDQAAADGTNPSSITSSRDDTLHKLAAAIEKAKGLDGRSSKWSEHTQTMKVGSLMYMAPEVMVGSTYSEKVDVFSFGVMMFEICSGRVNMAKIAVEGDAEQVAVYAEKVAGGWREDLPVGWPKELRELISACWSHASSERPSFKEVVRKLQQMQRDTAVAEALDAYTQKRAAYDPMNDCGCGCCLM